ncbi:hypothetical protein WDZ92_45130, partial [Nostoc sp. NIES-2111]
PNTHCHRKLDFENRSIEAGIYRIEDLWDGDSFEVRVVIGDPRSTIVVRPGQKARVDKFRNVLLENAL